MNSEEYIQEYNTIELEEAIRLCNEHGSPFSEYQKDYPTSGLNGWVDSKQLLSWLGY